MAPDYDIPDEIEKPDSWGDIHYNLYVQIAQTADEIAEMSSEDDVQEHAEAMAYDLVELAHHHDPRILRESQYEKRTWDRSPPHESTGETALQWFIHRVKQLRINE